MEPERSGCLFFKFNNNCELKHFFSAAFEQQAGKITDHLATLNHD